MSTETLTWMVLRKKQIEALARLGKQKNIPYAALVVSRYPPEPGSLIVVPPSSKDKRAWTISKGGKITKIERT